MHTRTKNITMLALFSAVSYAVMYLSKMIPINVLGFLTFDLKDVVIGLAGFIYGPLYIAAVSVIVSLIEMLTISSTGPWGFLMNVLSTCFFLCPAALFYRRRRSVSGAVLGLILGAILMTAAMLLWNYLVTPIYMGMPRQAVAELLLPVFLPFNLIKGGINAAMLLLLYKPIVTALRSAHLISASPDGSRTVSGGQRLGLILLSALALVGFVLLALVLAGIL
ncbi:MAG: ECF transporter S component [Oscillospiraceae bacterium]|nr:ECF transporter S component [Oscillospiraceae bacterium]